MVDGQAVGVVKDEDSLNQLLDSMKDRYTTENTVSVRFLDTVATEPVYEVNDLMTIREMEQALQANGNGSTTYTVVAGDTFNAIAYANDMSVSDLKALNPSVDINRLMVGDVLNVKELTPLLSVETVDDVTYVESIPCPVEEVKDSSLYKGSSKIITQGVEGEAQVDATITYVNGQETGRVINSTTTLREPTKTVKAVGTKEKPKTASSGSYQWPIRGRITSYFGGRYIFGSYSYHSGIDISASYGAAIRAADGGTVTYAVIRAAMASWSSSPMTMGRRPITAITPPCWSPRGRKCTRASRSLRRAVPGALPASTATLRYGSAVPRSTPCPI